MKLNSYWMMTDEEWDRFEEHASPQAIFRMREQVVKITGEWLLYQSKLSALLEKRQKQIRRGEWPTPNQNGGDDGRDKM